MRGDHRTIGRAPVTALALLWAMLALAAPTASARGGITILGPRPRTTSLAPASGRFATARAMPPPAMTAAAGGACVFYASDVGSQVGITPSPGSWTLSTLDLTPTPAFAHGVANITAASAPPGLSGVAPGFVPGTTASPIVETETGYDAIVTNTHCTPARLHATITSTPAAPAGDVEAILPPTTSRLYASLAPSFVDDGTWVCSNGFSLFYCEVWEVDLTLAFDANGAVLGLGDPTAAGTYTLTLNPPVYTTT